MPDKNKHRDDSVPGQGEVLCCGAIPTVPYLFRLYESEVRYLTFFPDTNNFDGIELVFVVIY